MKRLIPPDLQDLSQWPTVDPNALEGKRRKSLLNRIEAIRLYVAGTPLAKIEQATTVNRVQIFRLIRHCIEPHSLGPCANAFEYRISQCTSSVSCAATRVLVDDSSI
ncbi:hypothetical protein [Undibacterium umbellatum]|uniref:Transposase n=1 Tax=Undibacterium umbellatum TaxID=2762300 RepID=A0ABR6ZI60_9BURK|nr:hypothetical protein [Undibacterium umbellatum]MBC3910937.1 hypothetical protein [Undibacterium umbellatum]